MSSTPLSGLQNWQQWFWRVAWHNWAGVVLILLHLNHPWCILSYVVVYTRGFYWVESWSMQFGQVFCHYLCRNCNHVLLRLVLLCTGTTTRGQEVKKTVIFTDFLMYSKKAPSPYIETYSMVWATVRVHTVQQGSGDRETKKGTTIHQLITNRAWLLETPSHLFWIRTNLFLLPLSPLFSDLRRGSAISCRVHLQ